MPHLFVQIPHFLLHRVERTHSRRRRHRFLLAGHRQIVRLDRGSRRGRSRRFGGSDTAIAASTPLLLGSLALGRLFAISFRCRRRPSAGDVVTAVAVRQRCRLVGVTHRCRHAAVAAAQRARQRNPMDLVALGEQRVLSTCARESEGAERARGGCRHGLDNQGGHGRQLVR